MNIKNATIFLLLSLIFVFSTPTIAGKLYRWVDENGKVSFSDKVPPKYSRKEREELNESGRTIATKDAAKTPEQIKIFQRITQLRTVQQGLLDKQREKDSALLKTFQTEADIDALAKSKSEMIKSHIIIASGQSETLKKQLIVHQKVAANFERSGKKISPKTLDNIASAQAQFDKNQYEISQFKLQKEQLNEKLTKDKARFRVLRRQSKDAPNIQQDAISSLMLGELSCSTHHCASLWKKAGDFVEQHSLVIFTSDNLILSKPPKLSKDRSLSLTKLKQDHQTRLILDIRCADSKGGKATCKSNGSQQLVDKFEQLQQPMHH